MTHTLAALQNLIEEVGALVRENERLQEEVERYHRSLVAHHEITNLSEELAKHWGDPEGCPVCREAQK